MVERASGLLSACLFGLLVLCGCSLGRHDIACPGVSQTIRVQSGDRFFMDLEENVTTGYRWQATSNDPDVDVIIDHKPAKDSEGRVGVPGRAQVTIRIHRGYDGPSAVTFRYMRPWESAPAREFTITLFKRTGDCAAWE